MKLFFLLLIILVNINLGHTRSVKLWPLTKTTPNQVFPIWENVNLLIDKIGKQNIKDWNSKIAKINISMIKDKTPRDVLSQVVKFRTMLNTELHKLSLPSVNTSQLGPGQKLDPHTVFVNSLYVLDSICQWEEKKFAKIKDPMKYFEIELKKNKTPSHVHMQVRLAMAKLNVLFDSL